MADFGNYSVKDKRAGKNQDPKPACRVCGSEEEHSKTYNTPTMDCIKYLRKRIQELENQQAVKS